MKTIGVLTSGGDAPGMNAAIRAVVSSAIHYGCKVYGINRGFQGLLDEDLHEMDLDSVSGIIHKGGTILKSSRCEKFRTLEGRIEAVKNLNKYQIDSLVIIGGDGSFRGAQKISELGFPAIGIPGTIDNDLAYTDYTIGFDTAMNIVVDSIGKIKDTCTSHEKTSIVEVMGRHCGDIALYAGLAGGVEKIILPEIDFNLDDLCEQLKIAKSSGNGGSIIILAEGAGNAYELRDYISKNTNISSRVTVLGFIQRGGHPTAFDRILASKLGIKAVEILLEGKSAQVVGIKNNTIIHLDINEALTTVKEFDFESYKIASILSLTN